MKRAGLIAQP